MFTEELLESWMIDRVKEQNAISSIGFKVVDRIGAYNPDPNDPDAIAQFVRISPACLVGVGADNWQADKDSQGFIQTFHYTVIVDIITRGGWEHRDTSDNANALHRLCKQALRGQAFGPNDGSTAGLNVLRYRGRTPYPLDGGLLLIQQEYQFVVIDEEL